MALLNTDVDFANCHSFVLTVSALNVCCDLLSYSSTDSTAYSSAHFGQNSAVIIALDDVACTVYESRLVDCPYDSHIADCTHSEDAGVQCVPRKLSSHKCF